MEQKQIELKGPQVLQAYQSEQRKLEVIQTRKQTLQQLMAETVGAEQTLQEIEGKTKEEKVMIPLGAGLYIEGKVDASKGLKKGLGEGIIAKSTVKQSLKELEERKVEIRKDMERIQQQEKLTLTNLNNLGSAIEQARQKQKQKKEE